MDVLSEFLWFANKDMVKFVLNYIEDDYMVLDKPYHILKEAIHVVSGLYDNGLLPMKKSIKIKKLKP